MAFDRVQFFTQTMRKLWQKATSAISQTVPCKTLCKWPHPGKLETSTKCRLNVAPTFVMLVQHWTKTLVERVVFIWWSCGFQHLSKHEALAQCCYNVGPPSSTAAQHYNNMETAPRFCRRSDTAGRCTQGFGFPTLGRKVWWHVLQKTWGLRGSDGSRPGTGVQFPRGIPVTTTVRFVNITRRQPHSQPCHLVHTAIVKTVLTPSTK